MSEPSTSGPSPREAPEADDQTWFTAEVTRAAPELYATALRLTRNITDAEDLVADAVAQAWRRHRTLLDRAAFRAWIFRILTNAFLSARRAATARTLQESIDDVSESDANFSLFERLHQPFLLWWSSPEQEFLDKLLREDLERAVSALPEHFRLAVILADIHGLKYQEIAEIVGTPIGTVRSRLARGRALLQKALWQQGIDAGFVRRPEPGKGDTHA